MLRSNIRLFALALLLNPAALHAEPADPPEQISDEIIVQGAKKEIRRELWQILETTEGHVTRFDHAFCPIVIGFDAEWTPIIEKRIRANAVVAGLKPLDEPCKPSAVVIFIDQPQALMQGLRRKMPALFERNYPAEISALVRKDRPYYAWKVIVMRTIDGVEARGGVVPARATRLSSNVRYDIVNSYLVLNITKTPGMTLGQIGDFASLHLLAEFDRDAAENARSDSMLRLFDTDDPANLPDQMGTFDRAMIAGLYNSDLDDSPPNLQRGRLARSIAEELAAGEEPIEP